MCSFSHHFTVPLLRISSEKEILSMRRANGGDQNKNIARALHAGRHGVFNVLVVVYVQDGE